MSYHRSSHAGSLIVRTLAYLLLAALFSFTDASCCPGLTYFFENLVIYDPATANGASFLQNVDNKSPMTNYTVGITNIVPNDSNNLYTTGILLGFDLSCDNSTVIFTSLNAVNLPIPNAIAATPVIALIRRGACTWSAKLANAISAGASLNIKVVGVVIYDDGIFMNDDNDISDGASSSAPGYAPTIFLSNLNGNMLLSQINKQRDLAITTASGVREFVRLQIVNVQSHLTDNQEAVFEFPKGWVLWIIIVGTVMLTGLIWYKWHRIRTYLAPLPVVVQPVVVLLRQLRGTPPIPAEVLETFPVVRYEPGVCKNSECAICLDELGGSSSSDAEDKTKEIRVLPCQHGFCKECVGEWLLNNTALCPICKHNCLPPELRDPIKPESDEDIAAGASSSMHVTVDITDEIRLGGRAENVQVAAGNEEGSGALEEIATTQEQDVSDGAREEVASAHGQSGSDGVEVEEVKVDVVLATSDSH